MALFEFCRGRWGRVVFATEKNGAHLASEFFDGLSVSDQVKVSTLLKRFADYGQIRNREKFKKIADNLFSSRAGRFECSVS